MRFPSCAWDIYSKAHTYVWALNIYRKEMYMKRVLGKVTKEIALKYNLEEYMNKKIVIYDDARRHCYNRHMQEFGDSKTFHYIMDNLEDIICNPDNVFYIKNKQTLEYYKTYANILKEMQKEALGMTKSRPQS